MQCPSCQFENMPGSGHCARCAASLTVQASDIDVNPPRATTFERRIPARPLAMVRRGLDTFLEVWGRAGGLVRPNTKFQGSWREFLSLAIPGLHQRQHGEQQRGQMFLVVFLSLLACAIVFAGTTVGSLLLGLLFGWHVMATVDAISRRFAPGERIRFTAAVAVAVFVLLYLPSLWLIGRVATPTNIGMTTEHFQTGDVVWYAGWASADVGDLVMYYTPAVTAQGGGRNYPAVQFRVEGLRINRLVATEGQTVRMSDGQLYVDGEVSPWQPASKNLLPENRDMIVRPDNVFILPENLLPLAGRQISPDVAFRLGMVPTIRIQGVVFARSFPPTRVRFF